VALALAGSETTGTAAAELCGKMAPLAVGVSGAAFGHEKACGGGEAAGQPPTTPQDLKLLRDS
jgi:hypothetical protein